MRYRMVIYASPLYLDENYFVWKSEMVQKIANLTSKAVCLVVSFELIETKMSDRGASRVLALVDKFDKVVVEYGRKVDFGPYRDALERAGVEIYDGLVPETVFA